MSERRFEPDKALGKRIAEMDEQALCRFVIALCGVVTEEADESGYRGGIFPGNICLPEDGRPVIGAGKLSGWGGEELQYVAPELYWDGEWSAASDVYSLGLLLWYGLSGGRLPLEGDSPAAQLSRMSGKEIPAPPGAGVRLGEIVCKACSFRAEDRYADARELSVMLESCLDDRYESGAELFKKDEDALSEAERMMLAIIGGGDAAEAGEKEEAAERKEEEAEIPQLSREEAEELILAEHAPEKLEERDLEAEKKALVEEVFGEPEKPEEPEEPAAAEAEEPKPEEDVRVYEPGKSQKDHVPIPILTEEKNPELAPVIPSKRPVVQYSRNEERNRQITENVKKRRTRPVGVVLILCGLLIIAALFANNFLRGYEWEDEGLGKDVAMPEIGENAIGKDDGFVSGDELVRQQEAASRQTYYQVFRGDISWTAAKNACYDQGGTLAVINTSEEFAMVTSLVQQSGVRGVWVGCHREGGFLNWENTEPVGNMNWANNEPSYTDSRDGAAEDYIMLWNTGDGWAYIDCRNDPASADPGVYAGQIGYLCEFTN